MTEIVNIKNDFQLEVINTLKDVQLKVHELKEKIMASQSTIDRTEIRAPIDGVVTNMEVSTIGGVIQPGGKILDIVPQNEKLIVEINIRPKDIDSIYPGLKAKVQLAAYKARLIPRINGNVIYVSPDKTFDERGRMISNPNDPRHFYIAHIEIPEREIESINMDVKLQPGMPATVFIIKGKRTF